MLRTHLRNAGVGRTGDLRGLHHRSSPAFALSNPQRRGDVLLVRARARRARSSLPDPTAQSARGGLSNVPARRTVRGRELTSRPQSLPACTHVRLAKDLLVLLDPKRERLIYVLLADGTEKQKLAKIRHLVALTKVKRMWFVADELGQHDNLVYRVHSACKTDCWEVYAGADTFTTTQQMMLQNGMLPVCPATTAMRARIMPDAVDHIASRMRRPDLAFLLACRPAEAGLLFSDVAKKRALKASKRNSIKRMHRYANLLLAYRYAIREVSINDHISLVRNRDLEALRRRQQWADGEERGRLSRAYGFVGYVGSADAQMPHGPPLGAFDDVKDSSEEESGEEEEEEEEEVEDSIARDTSAASGERSAGGVNGLVAADRGSEHVQFVDIDKEGEGQREEPKASKAEGPKGRGTRVELSGGVGIVNGRQDREGGKVVVEGQGLAAGDERDEGDNEKEDKEEEIFEVVDEEEEEEEEEDDDDTGEEWESQDGKPPEVEITITVDKEGDKGKGDGYNCEVQLGPEADDFTARFNVNEAAVDRPTMDAMLEADGLSSVRTFLERCFKEEVRNLHTIQQLEKLWNRSTSTSTSTSSDKKGKDMVDGSRSGSVSSSNDGTGGPPTSKNSLTTRLNRQNRLSTGRGSSSPAEGPTDGSAGSKDNGSTDDGSLREGRRARPPYRMPPSADRSSGTNERPESSSSSSGRSNSSSQSPQGHGIRAGSAWHNHGQDHSSGVSRPGQDDAQGQGEGMMPHAIVPKSQRLHPTEPPAFGVQGGSSGSNREADQTRSVAGEEEGQELSVAEERDAAARRVQGMHTQQSSSGQENGNGLRTQGDGSRNCLDPTGEAGMKGTGRSLSSGASSSNSLSDAKEGGKDGDGARDEDCEEARSKDLPAEDSEEAQQLAHELLGRPVSSSEAAALVAALRQATDVFAVPEIAAAEAAQRAKAQAAAEAAAAAAAVVAGPGTTNTFSLSDLLQAFRDASGPAAAAASAGGSGSKPGVAGKRGGNKGGKGKKTASEARERRGKQLGPSITRDDGNNVDAMTRALMEVLGLDSMGKGMGNSVRLGRQRPQQQVRLLLEEWPGAWAQPPAPLVPEATSPPSRSSAPGNSPYPSRVPARRSRGSIFGRPLASRTPAAPPRGLGATGVTPAGISWGAIGGVGLALGSSGAQDQEEKEQEQEEQRRSSMRDLSVVARLMEALHKPPTEVTGEVGKDLIVTLDSGDSSSSSGPGSRDSAGAGIGLKKGGRKESDLIKEVGDAWCEYEQELMGSWVEGVGLSPAAFLQGS